MNRSAIAIAPVVLALMACGASGAPAADTSTTQPEAGIAFPASFQGRWNLNEVRCHIDDSGTVLTITDRQIIGYEDTSTLEALEVMDGGALNVTLHMESANYEGPIRMVMWRTSDDVERLHVEGDSRPQALVYELCEN